MKEDWWWMVSGKRIGPRPELREEFFRFAGVTKFHIYNTEQFLDYARKYLEVPVSEESIQGARDTLELFRQQWQTTRLPSLIPSSHESIVEEAIQDLADHLVDSDEHITGLMAETNAFGFGLDSYDITNFYYDENAGEIGFEATLEISGDQDEDKPYWGDTITARVSAVIVYEDKTWEIDSYEILSRELNW